MEARSKLQPHLFEISDLNASGYSLAEIAKYLWLTHRVKVSRARVGQVLKEKKMSSTENAARAILEAFMASRAPGTKQSVLWPHRYDMAELTKNGFSTKQISEFLRERGLTTGITQNNIREFMLRVAAGIRDKEFRSLRDAAIEILRDRDQESQTKPQAVTQAHVSTQSIGNDERKIDEPQQAITPKPVPRNQGIKIEDVVARTVQPKPKPPELAALDLLRDRWINGEPDDESQSAN